MGTGTPGDKQMRLRYDGVCRICNAELAAKTEAVYERATRTVRCLECAPAAEVGVAGASARREYERRKAKRDKRIRAEHPKLGGLILALSDDPQSTKAWATGAEGEERLGARLDGIASEAVVVLHDRRTPGTRANIDHLVVTGGGVCVIDAKHYRGRPRLVVEGGFLRPRVEKLRVGRRNCTDLVDGVLKQVELVRTSVGEVPVAGVLCFVDADWPLIGGSFTTRGVDVVWPRELLKLIGGSAGSVDVERVGRRLAEHFRPA